MPWVGRQAAKRCLEYEGRPEFHTWSVKVIAENHCLGCEGIPKVYASIVKIGRKFVPGV